MRSSCSPTFGMSQTLANAATSYEQELKSLHSALRWNRQRAEDIVSLRDTLLSTGAQLSESLHTAAAGSSYLAGHSWPLQNDYGPLESTTIDSLYSGGVRTTAPISDSQKSLGKSARHDHLVGRNSPSRAPSRSYRHVSFQDEAAVAPVRASTPASQYRRSAAVTELDASRDFLQSSSALRIEDLLEWNDLEEDEEEILASPSGEEHSYVFLLL